MLAVLEVLETKPSRDVTLNLLRIVNMVRIGLGLSSRSTRADLRSLTPGRSSRFGCHGAHMSNRRHSCHYGESVVFTNLGA